MLFTGIGRSVFGETVPEVLSTSRWMTYIYSTFITQEKAKQRQKKSNISHPFLMTSTGKSHFQYFSYLSGEHQFARGHVQILLKTSKLGNHLLNHCLTTTFKCYPYITFWCKAKRNMAPLGIIFRRLAPKNLKWR